MLDTTAYHRLGGPAMPDWKEALVEYFAELKQVRRMNTGSAMSTADASRPLTGTGKRRVGNGAVAPGALAERASASRCISIVRRMRPLQTVAELQAQGTDAAAFAADVADEQAVGRLFAQVMDRFGRLDALVTAAAVWEPQPLEEVTAADVRRQFEINTLGTFLCCQQAGRIMVAQPEGGAIVTIGDWACHGRACTTRPISSARARCPR